MAAIEDLSGAGATALAELRRRTDARRFTCLMPIVVPDAAIYRNCKHRHLVRVALARGVLRADRFIARHGRIPDALADFGDDVFPGPASRDLFGPSGPKYERTPTGFVLRLADPDLLPKAASPKPYSLEISYRPDRMPKGTTKP
ncbi:MAG TPA: hypothetical protein VNC50_17245 [Planctomycetia bacterium]|nr:hypothetical protein [Planctomycetia bacterium]